MTANIWPDRLMIRDTQLHDDMGGGGQCIYTTAGRGYEKREYIRADLASTSGLAGEAVAKPLDDDLLEDFRDECEGPGTVRFPRSNMRKLIAEIDRLRAVPPSIPAGGVREADGDYELAETVHGEIVRIKPRHSLKEQAAASSALVNELRKASSLPFPLIGAPIMADAASRIEDLEAENGQQTADISEFMQRLGPRWFLEQGWFPKSVGASDAV